MTPGWVHQVADRLMTGLVWPQTTLFMALLIIHNEGMPKVEVCSLSCTVCPVCLADHVAPHCKMRQHEGKTDQHWSATAKIRWVLHHVEPVTPAVRQSQSTVEIALVRIFASIGNMESYSPLMVIHECLEAMDDAICNCSVNLFLNCLGARAYGRTIGWTALRAPADVHV